MLAQLKIEVGTETVINFFKKLAVRTFGGPRNGNFWQQLIGKISNQHSSFCIFWCDIFALFSFLQLFNQFRGIFIFFVAIIRQCPTSLQLLFAIVSQFVRCCLFWCIFCNLLSDCKFPKLFLSSTSCAHGWKDFSSKGPKYQDVRKMFHTGLSGPFPMQESFYLMLPNICQRENDFNPIPFIFQPKNRKKFCWAQTFEL